jgi:hypothetical protein
MGRTFAVLGEGQPPVVVELESAPWLLGDFRRADEPPPLEPKVGEALESWLRARTGGEIDLASLAGGETCELRHGDEVELFASHFEVVPSQENLLVKGRPFLLSESEGPKAPYRSGHAEPALIARAAPSAPVVIRKLGG